MPLFWQMPYHEAYVPDHRVHFELLSDFMKQTLTSNTYSFIGEESSGKAAKSYKLLKSTRALLAYGDVYKIMAIARMRLRELKMCHNQRCMIQFKSGLRD